MSTCRACFCKIEKGGLPICQACDAEIQKLPIVARAKLVSQILRDEQHDQTAAVIRRLIEGHLRDEPPLTDWRDFGRN